MHPASKPMGGKATYWLSLLVAAIYESDGTVADSESKTDDCAQKKNKKRRRQKSIKFGVVREGTSVSLMSHSNIRLVMDMANRKALLDDALLRSGLGVHVEIGLLEHVLCRAQILRIHTKSLREHGSLDEIMGPRVILYIIMCGFLKMEHAEYDMPSPCWDKAGEEAAGARPKQRMAATQVPDEAGERRRGLPALEVQDLRLRAVGAAGARRGAQDYLPRHAQVHRVRDHVGHQRRWQEQGVRRALVRGGHLVAMRDDVHHIFGVPPFHDRIKRLSQGSVRQPVRECGAEMQSDSINLYMYRTNSLAHIITVILRLILHNHMSSTATVHHTSRDTLLSF